jgi:hypothetical protein
VEVNGADDIGAKVDSGARVELNGGARAEVNDADQEVGAKEDGDARADEVGAKEDGVEEVEEAAGAAGTGELSLELNARRCRGRSRGDGKEEATGASRGGAARAPPAHPC